jgi:hypothetical protein
MIRLIAAAGFALSRRNFGASNDASAYSSAGQHDHASSYRLRRWSGHA